MPKHQLHPMKVSSSTAIGFALLLTAITLGWLALSEWVAIDACLDAGGSFKYTAGVCDLVNSHRRPSASSSSETRILLAVCSGVIGLALLFRPCRAR